MEKRRRGFCNTRRWWRIVSPFAPSWKRENDKT